MFEVKLELCLLSVGRRCETLTTNQTSCVILGLTEIKLFNNININHTADNINIFYHLNGSYAWKLIHKISSELIPNNTGSAQPAFDSFLTGSPKWHHENSRHLTLHFTVLNTITNVHFRNHCHKVS